MLNRAKSATTASAPFTPKRMKLRCAPGWRANRPALKQDLDTGEWARRYAELLTLDACDAGYRLVVAG
jgi:hypothetical protein